ncbi:MAG: thymidylate synthase [Cyanobacteria bacterium P01_E01_bin.42]
MTAIAHPTQFPYQPRYKPNQVLCGTGQTAIVTGWTVKGVLAKRLESSEYAAIGQLYSPTRGISLLLRNLLLNPHVRFLVVLNATQEDRNAGGSRCLLDFFQYGFKEGKSDTGRDIWQIKSAITGYIDREIPAPILEQLRHDLEVREASSIDEAISLVKSYAGSPLTPLNKGGKDEETGKDGELGKPLEFPLPQTVPTIFPGDRYGHLIKGKTIAETWVKIIHRIKTTGTIRPTGYDGKWQELIDLMAVVTDEPEAFYFPEPNYLPCDRAFLQEYIAQMRDDAPQREGVKYTYGQRLRSWFGRDQIEQLINKLSGDIDSARAVMSLWDVKDYDGNNSPPCLNHIWVRIVNHELSLTATFRSNDMFGAWVTNAMGLRGLQQYICAEIIKRSQHRLKMGALITVSQSAHIYDDCWENAEHLIQKHYARVCRDRAFDDPIGSFTISVRDNTIVVEHLTPGSGEVVDCYTGKTARQLYQKIAADCPGLEVEHALYLGTELQKAEISLSLKGSLTYTQDRKFE